jgi:hypothetical protein
VPDRLTELEQKLRALIAQDAFAEARTVLEQYSVELERHLRSVPPGDAGPARLLTGALDLFIWVRFSTLASRQHAAAALAQLETAARYNMTPESAVFVDVSSI